MELSSTDMNDNTCCSNDGFGHQHFSSGRFYNPWSDAVRELGRNIERKADFIKFLTMARQKDKVVANSTSKRVLDQEFPVRFFDGTDHEVPPEIGLKLIWLGHATCLVQFDGITVLTDPALSKRCSPIQLIGFPKRFRKIPCPINKLPSINIVLVSHNHYDHLDYNTVKILDRSQGSRIHWFVGLGLKKWFTDIGCENVHEMDWWEEHSFSEDVKVVFTPTQRWSKRTAFDTNKTLWGSWIVKGPRHSFIHLGDTGYCQTFKTIGEEYGPFDLAAIPIGAYHPRSFLEPQHVDPTQAVMIHKDIKAKRSLGIHWGTFTLGKEPILEPPRLLNEALLKEGIHPHEFKTCSIGEDFFKL